MNLIEKDLGGVGVVDGFDLVGKDFFATVCVVMLFFEFIFLSLSLPFLPFFLILGISYCLAVFLIPCLYQFQFVFLQFIIFSLSHSLP